ncbi:phospholipid-translocating P-type ATPase [Mycotypha africana]|uniref:phospholipid-translocating P-type ATPase n=1 Tax=Mycotypha africana TaxID=64632 RepID=UPI002301EE58|nr:phospholipid-translocating P-type ATPase [Mycotypha africana]KAI8982002.1 phospholipid-translocating P-type ATPase [Mycotypha africana]
MYRDSRPIALRKLNPFNAKQGSNRKHRTSDSIHSDEDPLLDEEAALPRVSSAESTIRSLNSASTFKKERKKKQQKFNLLSMFKRKKVYKPRTITFNADDREKRRFCANVIVNQKYNIFTFIPVVLFEQFVIFFNLYFLLVALSQFVPALKIGYILTYFGPLCFVLFVTISKEALDDYQRYKRDKEANSQLYRRLTPSGHQNIPSSKIKVGDMIHIMKDQRIPADMILLRTTEESGASFIRTDQLDGETDWKLRLAIPSLQSLPSDQDLLDIKGSVYADAPHKDIHSFVGNLTIIDDHTQSERIEPLGVENTMWTNTVLASGSAVGFVVYTGSDTRAVMNTNHPKTKVGLIDQEINGLAKILFAVTLALSVLMVGLNGFRGIWYIYVFRFLILFSSIIPIGLRVNLDMGKSVYARQIEHDKEIRGTIVRTSTLPEELGRIEYLLTDKTGTLTQNDMELKKLHMGTMSYSQDTMDEIQSYLVNIFETSHDNGMINKGRRHIASRVRDIVQALALCHNVTPVISFDGNITYQASSPDEVAIVKWTEQMGLTLVNRDVNTIELRVDGTNQVLYFDVLNIFPFSSETKRMGIIVRNKQTQEITFYEKGADTVMAKIVQYNDWLDEECDNMAREGLRTLVVAKKNLSEESYQEFTEKYHEAEVSLDDRKAMKQEVVANLLEANLELLGLTGVEDKLQEGVKNTLEQMRNAGLRIWMLTGDKIETATCIAISSKLISRNQGIHTVARLKTSMEAADEIDNLRHKTDNCLVIDGESIQLCLDNFIDEFIEIVTLLPVVVCCRCSPTQKAEITRLIKEYTKRRVLCIGDGGNDVSMIQAADVGVGIVGKEGKQASLAADFSITQFSHLTKLLLWHGRNSYKRSAKLSQFVIHRGLIISVMQAVFSALFYFAPIALYQGMLIVGYATIYTNAPVFSLVLDQDVSQEIAMMYPELYKDLRKGRSLTYRTFFTWLLISVYQGGTIMILSLILFENEFIHIVAISFTALIFNELLMVALEINTWHKVMIIAELITVLIYFGSMWLLPTYFDMKFILTTRFLWKVAVITAVSSCPLYFVKMIKRRIAPPSYTKLT